MLSSDCRTEEFACKPGYKRFSDDSTRCYPTGCQEGALQVRNIGYSCSQHTKIVVGLLYHGTKAVRHDLMGGSA